MAQPEDPVFPNEGPWLSIEDELDQRRRERPEE